MRRSRPPSPAPARRPWQQAGRRPPDFPLANKVTSQPLREGGLRPPRPRSRLAALALLAAIALIAANLRPAITSVGPVVGEIRADIGISSAAAGLLTALPVLAFGLLAPVAPVLGRRFGIEAVLLGSMVGLAAGVLLRWAPGLVPLFAGTVILGAAIAFGNVLLPALVKRDFPHRQGVVTALYSSVLGATAAIASGIAVPLADDAGLEWDGALAVWALPAALAAAVWLPRLRERHRAGVEPDPTAALRDLWRSPLAWQVTAFWAMQSFNFYAILAWLPELLVDEGLSAAQGGLMLLVAQLSGVTAMLVIPPLAERRPDQRGVVAGIGACMLTGLAGLIVAPDTGTVVWALILGFGQGASLSLSLLLFVLRSREHRTAAELSGMAQTVGYLVAATGPVAVGLLHDASGGWTLALLLLLVFGVAQVGFGVGAGRDAVVEGR